MLSTKCPNEVSGSLLSYDRNVLIRGNEHLLTSESGNRNVKQ